MEDLQPAKHCPFGAETTLAALDRRTAERTAIEGRIANYTRAGWQVVSQTDTSVQLRRAKRWSLVGVVLLVLLPNLGISLYKEEITYITADD
jgi:hypothetical protein